MTYIRSVDETILNRRTAAFKFDLFAHWNLVIVAEVSLFTAKQTFHVNLGVFFISLVTGYLQIVSSCELSQICQPNEVQLCILSCYDFVNVDLPVLIAMKVQLMSCDFHNHENLNFLTEQTKDVTSNQISNPLLEC